MNFAGIGIKTTLAVDDEGIILPAAFPELIADVEKLIRLSVTLVMRQQLFVTHRPCGTVQVAGDDVPANPPLRKMVERRDDGQRETVLHS